MSETIGFIGVGLMGHGMAKNIVEKGYALTVMGHRNRQPIEDLLTRGAKEAKSPKAVGEASSIVFLCVTGSKQVEGVIRGPEGLAASLKPGSIIVDCSTSDPTSTMALAEELAAKGITLVDAPLSRTPKEAWEGKLDTMVGCTDEIFNRFAAGEGQAYLVGGFNVSYLRRGDVVLIPVRMGVGLRLGINAGYMKFSKKQKLSPF